jgi:glucokinase-like ROK family protein
VPVTQKATQEQTKLHNKRLILKTIYDEGQISRADIARATRLTRPTVSSIVADLMEEGLVVEVGQGPSKVGKPATLLSVVDDSRHLIGIDLAESVFRGCVVNLRGEIKHRVNLPVRERDGDAALALVFELIDELLARTDSTLLGIGIGTPGLMDARHGVVREAVNLDWPNLPLGALLDRRYGLPVYVANDCQVAALGEYIFGKRQDVSSLLVIKAGRGIGSGIVLNGRLYHGDGFGAGEIGHVVVVEQGALCRCGHFGCLETVASSRAIVQRAQAIARSNPQSPLHRLVTRPEEIDTNVVMQAFQAGDKELAAYIDVAGRYLGRAVANLVAALNIQHISIAGSITRFGQPLLEPVRQEMSLRAPPVLVPGTRVDFSSLGPDIVILGAAALLLSHELGLM